MYKNAPQPLSSLKGLQPLQCIKQLPKELLKPKKSRLLNQVEFFVYTANLCLYSSRILKGEIQINNSDEILGKLINEVMRASKLLDSKDFYFDNSYTKKTTKKFFNEIGLKPKHLKN